MRIAFVIPALNEEQSIGRVLDEIPRDLDTAVVIVADNGSTDRTGEVAAAHGAGWKSTSVPGAGGFHGRGNLAGLRHA